MLHAISFRIFYYKVKKKANFELFFLSPGTVFMPAKWSLGYQQCRWSYLSAQRVLEVLELEMLNMTCIPSLKILHFKTVKKKGRNIVLKLN
jgi:alpha-glucosidase (family GH31 glycosyl hydrolase)